jgi:hypothetical protein
VTWKMDVSPEEVDALIEKDVPWTYEVHYRRINTLFRRREKFVKKFVCPAVMPDRALKFFTPFAFPYDVIIVRVRLIAPFGQVWEHEHRNIEISRGNLLTLTWNLI